MSDLDALFTQRTSTLADFLKRETRDRVSDIAAASTRLTRVESDVKTLVDDLALRFESIGNMVDARLTAQSAEVKKVKDDLSQFKVQVVLDQRNANTVLTAGLHSAPTQPTQPQPQPTLSQPQPSQSQPQPSQPFQSGSGNATNQTNPKNRYPPNANARRRQSDIPHTSQFVPPNNQPRVGSQQNFGLDFDLGHTHLHVDNPGQTRINNLGGFDAGGGLGSGTAGAQSQPQSPLRSQPQAQPPPQFQSGQPQNMGPQPTGPPPDNSAQGTPNASFNSAGQSANGRTVFQILRQRRKGRLP